jgi:hypothetical protein
MSPRAPHWCGGCRLVSVPAGTRYCPTCAAAHERRRGTTSQRGYGSGHQKTRLDWTPAVEAGRVDCWRCGQRIESDEEWHLGHDDVDRRRHRGPEHARQCNLRAAGRSAH